MSYLISVIIPAFNEENNISVIAKKVIVALKTNSYELIFVDDGSTDGTLRQIKKLAKLNDRIKFISFSKNFGHQSALLAGLKNAKGDAVISMDCDLQHPPELISEMIKHWKEGFDVVYTVRDDSQTPFIKKITSQIFYKLINALSDIDLETGVADFRLIDRKVVRIINKTGKRDMFLRGLIKWVGFKQYSIKYLPSKRFSGDSKYSLIKMFHFAVNGITSFSFKPLRLASFLGSLVTLFSVLYIFYALGEFYVQSEHPFN